MYIVDREKTPLCSNKFFPEHSGAPGTTIIKKNCAAVPSFSLQGKKDKMREIESSKQTFVTLNLISANTYKSGVFVGPFFRQKWVSLRRLHVFETVLRISGRF